MGLLIIYFLTTSNLLKTVFTLTIKQTVVNNDIINIVISLILTLKSGNKLAPQAMRIIVQMKATLVLKKIIVHIIVHEFSE